MKDLKNKFLKILKVELEDLADDINILIEHTKEEQKSGRLSNYVMKENISIFENELRGISAISKELDSIDIEIYSSVDDLFEKLKIIFNQLIKKFALVKAGYIIVEKRLDKVYKYITGDYGV